MSGPYTFGHKSEGIRILQQALADHGFKPGEIDGIYGRATLNAIEDARSAFKLTPGQGVDEDLLYDLGIIPKPKDTTMNNVNVDVNSAWLSTKNWAAIVGILSVILPLFGVHLPVGWGDTLYQVIAALSGAYILVKNTWFTTSITTASAKKL